MSTRAVFTFRRPYLGSATVYIHHDGYPEGAAHYFARAIVHGGRGGMAERMIRANEFAELTSDADAIGDADYRYTLHRPNAETASTAPDTLRAERRIADTWVPVFNGTLAEFLTLHSAETPEWSELAEGHRWATLGRECVTVADLTERARTEMRRAYEAAGRGWTGNASSAAGEAARMVGAGADIPTAEVIECLTVCCADCPHMVDFYLAQASIATEVRKCKECGTEGTSKLTVNRRGPMLHGRDS